jgi:hypothetical protein
MPKVSRYVQTLNKPQQLALKSVFDRRIIARTFPALQDSAMGPYQRAITYREFRKTVRFSFDCAMVEWCGMWLGIEQDGYTHS